ncbi:hypothetical protein D9M69_279690 [compost metagenome]
MAAKRRGSRPWAAPTSRDGRHRHGPFVGCRGVEPLFECPCRGARPPRCTRAPADGVTQGEQQDARPRPDPPAPAPACPRAGAGAARTCPAGCAERPAAGGNPARLPRRRLLPHPPAGALGRLRAGAARLLRGADDPRRRLHVLGLGARRGGDPQLAAGAVRRPRRAGRVGRGFQRADFFLLYAGGQGRAGRRWFPPERPLGLLLGQQALPVGLPRRHGAAGKARRRPGLPDLPGAAQRLPDPRQLERHGPGSHRLP